MTLLNALNANIGISQSLEFLLRVLCASLCGAIIGIERSRRLKEAGVRTHLLVACTAAVMMVISKYGFADLVRDDGGFFPGTDGADPARIAAQVVSAVSFLGAGIIFRSGTSVRGLTTAAGVWATAGIGLAFGSGMYLIGACVTLFILITQSVTHKFAFGYDNMRANRVVIVARDDDDTFQKSLNDQLERWNAQLMSTSIAHKKNGTTHYTLLFRTSKSVNYDTIIKFMRGNQSIVSFSVDVNA